MNAFLAAHTLDQSVKVPLVESPKPKGLSSIRTTSPAWVDILRS